MEESETFIELCKEVRPLLSDIGYRRWVKSIRATIEVYPELTIKEAIEIGSVIRSQENLLKQLIKNDMGQFAQTSHS